jgi:putative transposase
VSPAGFYAWLDRPSSDKAIYGGMLEREIRSIFVTGDQPYGARRNWGAYSQLA